MGRSGSPTRAMASTPTTRVIKPTSEIGSRNVYRLDPESGDLTAVVEDFTQPNGLAFSPDERRLFIGDSEQHHIRVFDVDHGSLTGGEPSVPTTRVTTVSDLIISVGSGERLMTVFIVITQMVP